MNDECTGAFNVIPGADATCTNSLVVTADNTGATRSLPDCAGSAEDDIWFKFTATSKRHAINVTTTELIYPVLELFTGNCSSLTSLGCHTNTGISSLTLSVPLLDLTPGQTYYYRVFGSGSGNQRLPISTCITTIPPAPLNDECSGAIQITANSDASSTYSYMGAAGYASQSFASCVYSYYSAADVWFKFVATAATQKITVTPPGDLDYVFQLYSGTCNNLISLACANNGSFGQPDTALINLTIGSTYYIRVYDYNGNNNPLQQFKIVINTQSVPGLPTTNTGTGLKGQYYNGISLSGDPLITRTDTTINLELTYSKQPVVLSPAPGIIPEDLFSVRWSGQIQALRSETYTFYTVSDDGIRLWVNGIKLVDNWTNQGATEKSGSITLVAGQKYDIVAEYYENTGEATAKLYWSSASMPKAIVPKAQLFPSDGVNATIPLCVSNISPVNAATVPARTSATLVWPKAANATGYLVYVFSANTNTPVEIANTQDTTLTVTGLTRSTVYKWYVSPLNATGTAINCAATNTTTFTTADANAIVGDGAGLYGYYFNNTTLAGSYVLLRNDPVINFDLFNTSPGPGIVNSQNYSVRWMGQVQAQYSETYTFYANTDDGVRLWVNGVQLIENWTNQGAVAEKNGSISLAAGQKYDIKIEYYQNTGTAVAKLLWSSSHTPKAIIPTSQLYQPPQRYFCASNVLPANNSRIDSQNSATLKWSFLPVEYDGKTQLFFDLYLWSGNVAPATATVSDITVPYSQDNIQYVTYNVTGLVPGTLYKWYVLPKTIIGTAVDCINNAFSFTTAGIAQPATGTGLRAVYYGGISLTGNQLLTRIDTTINFELTYSHQPLSPAPGIVPEDNYSVRWTGKVQPLYSENYTFYTIADDGIRLWVNGVKLIDNWTNQGATEKSGTITLVAGQKYDIIIEYYEATGEAVTKLYWSSFSTLKQIIPKSQLYPPDATSRMINSTTSLPSGSFSANAANSSAFPLISAMVSPNPVRPGQQANILITSDKTAAVIMNVIGANGNIINSQKINLVVGVNKKTINTMALAQGMYFINITGASKPVNMKLLVE